MVQKTKDKYKCRNRNINTKKNAQKSYSKAPQALKEYDAKYGEEVYTLNKHVHMKEQQWKREEMNTKF